MGDTPGDRTEALRVEHDHIGLNGAHPEKGAEMSPEPEKPFIEPIVETLIAEWAAIENLLLGLAPPMWSTPTALPGWTVHDVVAHLVGTESRLDGEEEPSASFDVTTLAHVRNAIGASNERWIRALRSEQPAELLLRFQAVTSRRAAALRSMSREQFDAETPTPVGQASYHRFMEIRLFDCWLHEQDIRHAIGQPGHEDGPCAEASIDEVVRALGFIVGKQAAAPDGSTVTIELTGPVRRTLHVAVDGRAKVVSDLTQRATATIHLASTDFVMLAGGRADAIPGAESIHFDGDRELGMQVAQNLAFTI